MTISDDRASAYLRKRYHTILVTLLY